MKSIRPDSEMASGIVSVPGAAVHFGVDPATVRRWLQCGCPCVRKGQRGPGRGALLDLREVEVWRDKTNGPVGFTADVVLEQVAEAFENALLSQRVDIGADIERKQAAFVLLRTFEVCAQTFGRRFSFDDLPPGIRAVARVL